MNLVPGRMAFFGLFLVAILVCGDVAVAHDDSATDGLIDGGGNPAKDCVVKFQTGLELNYPAAPKRPRELRCTDGDLACDSDGIVDGSCTIPLGLCFLDDEDPFCDLAGLAPGSVVIRNKPLGHRRYDADAAALQVSVDNLLGSTGLACDDPGAGGGNCFHLYRGESAGRNFDRSSPRQEKDQIEGDYRSCARDGARREGTSTSSSFVALPARTRLSLISRKFSSRPIARQPAPVMEAVHQPPA